MTFYCAYQIRKSIEAQGIFTSHLPPEILFYKEPDVYYVHAGESHIILQTGFRLQKVRVQFKSINKETLQTLFNFFITSITA